MKKLVYGKMLNSWTRRFMKDPAGFSKKVGVSLVDHKYGHETYVLMIEAMAVSVGVNPSSALYCEIEKRLREIAEKMGVYFDRKLFEKARNAQVKELLKPLPEILAGASGNKYLSALCMYLMLPVSVARKWVWHENVDLQSVESFLRRMTDKQFQSLKHHFQLVGDGVESKDLPCFTDGMCNRVWRFFNPTFKEQGRMDVKAAIAHDFLGLSMGFKLYPSAVEDVRIDQDLASQFLSKRKRDTGDFELNTEHGGLYWLLYRKLRSNTLYGEKNEVKLGRWVCPGFWVTIVLWGILAVVSPVSLLAGIGILLANGVVSLPLFGLGAILPVILGAIGIKKACGKAYNSGYWTGVLVGIVAIFVSIGIYRIFDLLKELPTLYAGIACLVFLVPYCVINETWKFWRAPVMGKLFPLLFLSVLAFDLYTNTSFFQFCWSVVVSSAMFLYGVRYLIFGCVAVALAYAALCIGLIYLSELMLKSTDAMIEKGIVGQRLNVWITNGFVALSSVMFVTVLAQVFTRYGIGSWALYLVGAPFLMFLIINLGMRKLDDRIKNLLVQQTVDGGYWLSKYKKGVVRAAVCNNCFWTEIAHSTVRGRELNKFLIMAETRNDNRFEWIVAILRSVKSDEEFGNAKSFVSSDSYRYLCIDVNSEILTLILAGATEEILDLAIRAETDRLNNLPRISDGKEHWVSALFERFINWMDSTFLPVAVPIVRFFTWPIRASWKGVKDLYRLLQAFNEQCPPSPPTMRPSAQ